METELPFLKDRKISNLELGNTFRKQHGNALHTVRYDFKPASVDINQEAHVEIGESNEVTITLPHTQGSKNCTVYKGSKKPAQKECVLIYDPQTSTFVLERVSSQIQVKKTRLADNARLPQMPTVLPTSKVPKMPGKKTAPPKPTKLAQETKKPEIITNPIVPEEKLVETNLVLPQTIHPQHSNDHFVNTAITNTLSSSDDDSDSSTSSSSSNSSSSSSADVNKTKNGSPFQSQSQLYEDLQLSDSDSDSD
uniref:ELL-associated factor 1-like n=1 Tax=Phallusia mammillata TaxID=59560 RepID=A0A6F9DBE1_9ASCI|nr:ELL-associated factor 1-like [Phallusia mammillata]